MRKTFTCMLNKCIQNYSKTFIFKQFIPFLVFVCRRKLSWNSHKKLFYNKNILIELTLKEPRICHGFALSNININICILKWFSTIFPTHRIFLVILFQIKMNKISSFCNPHLTYQMKNLTTQKSIIIQIAITIKSSSSKWKFHRHAIKCLCFFQLDNNLVVLCWKQEARKKVSQAKYNFTTAKVFIMKIVIFLVSSLCKIRNC